MASNILAGDQLNFTRMGIASVDEIKVVLADILKCEIKPQNLHKSITSCSELMTGRHKLRPEQLRLCCPSLPGVPDYNKFDVSLLYTLIRNLCSQLKPTQGWGKPPSVKDLQVGDDIERLRVFRNEIFAHVESYSVEDIVFTLQWQNLEQIFQRMQTFLNQKGLSVNYEKNLKSIAKADFGLTDMEKYKLLLEGTMYLLKKYPINDDPSITIRGKAEVLCGENTFFEAELDNCPPSSNWPITWEKFQGNVTEQLDISREKYTGSSSRFLVLPRVLMEDKGEYRAVISREHVKIQSNAILLTVRGELPRLQKLKVTPEKDDINIQYKYEISQEIPKVHHIAWTKNGKVLKIDNMKYIGGNLKDNLLKITSPSVEDRGRYTCTITNAVGSVSESLILDPPNISNDHLTRINSQSVILTCEIFPYDQSPPLTKLEWQRDGYVIDIPGSEGKYTGGTIDEPSLTITNVNQSDAGLYQCNASNAVGSTFGEAIFLGVPVFQVLGPENTDNGTSVFQMNSSSCPAVISVQWSKKNKDNDEYTPIDVNDKEYFGTSNSLPNPKLVIKQVLLHKYSFKVDAQNFIGTSTKKIPDDSSCAADTSVDNKANKLAAIFKDKGTLIKFDKLRRELIKEIPETELNSLKECIKVIAKLEISTENIATVEGFFSLILKEGIFRERNVILMQYLLESIGRPDLEQKCVEYAKKEKQASCYYKEPEYPEDGHVYVQLHVKDDIQKFVDKDSLFETVAAMVGCDKSCLKEAGLRPERSFIIIISMKKDFAEKLVRKDLFELRKLLQYTVDWIKVGNKVIDIAQGSKREIEDVEVLGDRLKRELRMGKNEGNKDSLAGSRKKIIANKRYTRDAEIEDRFDKEENLEGGDPSLFQTIWNWVSYSFIEIFNYLKRISDFLSPPSITLPEDYNVCHISCVTSDRLWVSDHRRLLQVDSTGHVEQEMEIKEIPYDKQGGAHSVTEDGDLVFINGNKVQKRMVDGTITTLFEEREVLYCIHSSRINGDILVCYESGVLRCDWMGDHRIKLEFGFSFPIFITENRNGDIWVSDKGRGEVVVMDKSGEHRFNYRGQHQSNNFFPRGICTDILGQVLVCNSNFFNPSVHVLDEDGQFLRLLLKKEHGLYRPLALCVDDKHNLYVGEMLSNTISVYKYLQETENSSSIVESKKAS